MAKIEKSLIYDLLILGAGGTGLATAMYAGRLGLKTLVLGASNGTELPVGGIITTTHIVENYPGFKSISGMELAKKIEEHAREYKEVDIKSEKAIDVKKTKQGFEIKTEKNTYSTKALVFATGTKWKELEVEGSKEFKNMGVSYCALCDAPLFKNKVVAIVGGSDSAAKESLILAEHAKKVYIIYRGKKIHPEPITLQMVEKNKKIEQINNINIVKIQGDKNGVSKIVLDGKVNGKQELQVDGVFVAIGHIVLSDIAKSLGVKLNEKQEIIIDHKTSSTNIPGVYAAGDVTDKPFKQLITGVADGCTAAYSAYEYITGKKAEGY